MESVCPSDAGPPECDDMEDQHSWPLCSSFVNYYITMDVAWRWHEHMMKNNTRNYMGMLASGKSYDLTSTYIHFWDNGFPIE